VRVDGKGRRPPLTLFTATLKLRKATAPTDRSFREWAPSVVGDEQAARLAAYAGAATFDHDPARLSADFLRTVILRATSLPPTVRYFPGGWATLVERVAARARELGVVIETGSRVEALPEVPVIVAVPPATARTQFGLATSGVVHGTSTALLDLGLRSRRDDPYVLSDLDGSGFAETFTTVDPTLAPPGEHLVQAQAGLRPGEELADAVTRLERFLDVGYEGWRGRETWRRRARIHDESGALDRPGTTWRDRPPVRQADGVWLVNDFAAHPGLLSEVSHGAALEAVEQLGAPARTGPRMVLRS
jgi:phytoene dehydrogenase-like protein